MGAGIRVECTRFTVHSACLGGGMYLGMYLKGVVL
jgi:hypothetical protein